MSCVVGIDLSSRAIDLAYVDENENTARWSRCHLTGAGAWARTLSIGNLHGDSLIFEDVYLIAIEAPYGRGQAGTQAVLNRVVGAVAASLPAELRQPERCWIVRPDEWKRGLGLSGKPSRTAIEQLLRPMHDWEQIPDDQNARDAACLALWARDTNARAVREALSA